MNFQEALSTNRNINYDDLWNMWLESHQQNTPQGFYNVRNNPNAPKNYFLTPEDMMKVLNAFTPYDLYMKPDITPKSEQFGYPTAAVNIKNFSNDLGIKDAILQVSQDPQSLLSFLQTIYNYKFPIQALGPQAIYEHEVGHYQDPRLNSSRPYSYPNLGYMTRFGFDQPTLMREAPAMVAEERFWNRFRKK